MARTSAFLVLLLLPLLAVGQKLLVIYMDGMRWDYVQRRLSSSPVSSGRPALHPSDGLRLMRRFGASVQRLRPVFPTQCLPNIHTAFTGRFPSSHGVLADQMYDASSRFSFDFHRGTNSQFRASPAHWWARTEPLWDSLSLRHGKRSSIYHLPSAHELRQMQNRSVPGDLFVPFRRRLPWSHFRDRLFEAMGRLRRNLTDFAVVYSNVLDSEGHSFGPDSAHVETTMEKLDSLLTLVIQEVTLDADWKIHVMLLSDHGMQTIAQTREINLEWRILRSQVEKVVNSGSVAGIWPRKEYFGAIYNRLQSGVKAGEKYTIHITTGVDARTPPIIVEAEPGYLLISKNFRFPRTDLPMTGFHGYPASRSNMHTPMLVLGPKIQPRAHVKTMDVVEIYQLMCHMLGITPRPNNGTFHKLSPLLRSSAHAQPRVLQSATLPNSASQQRLFHKLFCVVILMCIFLS